MQAFQQGRGDHITTHAQKRAKCDMRKNAQIVAELTTSNLQQVCP